MDTARPWWASLRTIGLAALAAVAVAAALLVGTTPAHGTPSKADLEQQIKQQSKQFDKVVEQYNKITAERKKTKKRIAAVDEKLKPLAGKVAKAQKQVDAIAAAAYKGGPATAWNAVLGGNSSETLNSIATLDRLSARKSDQVSSLVSAKRTLDGKHQKLAKLSAKQSKQAKELKKKKSSISAKVDKLKKLRKQAYGSATETVGTGSGQNPPQVSGRAGAVVDFAYAQLGKPYAWAAAGPNSYDCSGLTLAAWQQAGVSLPHVAADQYNQITHISRSQVAPGDLVFYENLGHVAIYVGSGKVIHAPTFGEVVKVSSIDMMPVYGIGRP